MKVSNSATKIAWQMSWAWLLVCAWGVGHEVLARGAKRASAIVSGSVYDNRGNPLRGAVVSLVREGTAKTARQIRSSADGKYRTRIAPGRYLLSAMATGFQQFSFGVVNARQAQELIYRFNLTPVGSGRTLPELRRDRDDSKWVFRSVFKQRSIFQIQPDGTTTATKETDETTTNSTDTTRAETDAISNNTSDAQNLEQENGVYETASPAEDAPRRSHGRTRGVVETYFIDSPQTPNTSGLNFALSTPATSNLTFVFAGQTGTGAAPQRLETTAQVRLADNHQINLSASAARLNTFAAKDVPQRELSQIAFRAVDEWTARPGIVIVLGVDYARLVGSGANATRVIKPRLGVQFDLDSNTRLRGGITPSEALAAPGAETQLVEDSNVTFRQHSTPVVASVNGHQTFDRSRRVEIGLERVLDNASTIEATAYLDTADGRGVGFQKLPLTALRGSHTNELNSIALQEGATRGLRLVYTRRVGHLFTATAGYSIGRGQRFSAEGLNNPAQLFENATFQTAALQIGVTPRNGTRVHTVLRFSPQATVFAIDPLAERLAVYDPSLSVLITQQLPTFGLGIRAEAIIDARNLFDLTNGTDDGEQSLSLLSNRRSVRGGIALRF